MLKEFILPDLGDGIKKAVVLKVFVKPGDHLETDAPVVEIESDKATIEVPSTVSGLVKEVRIREGEEASEGMVLLIVETAGTGSVPPAPSAASQKVVEPGAIQVPPPASAGTPALVEVTLPDLGDGIKSAEILKVLVKPGDPVQADQGILEVGSDKATIEVPSPVAGTVSEILVKEGEKAEIGQVVLKILSGSPAPASVSAAPSGVPAVPQASAMEVPAVVNPVIPVADVQPVTRQNAAPAAPSVRRLAREIGVNVNEISGTGPGGRITQEDVKAWSKKLHQTRGSSSGHVSGQAPGFAHKPLPDFSKFGPVERKSMSTIRYKTAEHLSYAWQTIPHVTQFDKADVTVLESLRKQFSPSVEKVGAKLTMTAILVKVLAAALRKYPQFNASVDMESKEIILKSYVNIGIAVDTDAGLIVPVIRDADKKNISTIALALTDIAGRARNRKITPEDLQGGCMSITNLGGIGGTSFTPIVNSPEVAILGVSRGSMEPVWNGSAFEPKLMLPLSLSYDHRIIDGADAARFLRWVCEALEQPLKLLIEG